VIAPPPRPGDEGSIDVEGVGDGACVFAPKNDANGLIRPNLAGVAFSRSLSLSFPPAVPSGGTALLTGGKGNEALSDDRSYAVVWEVGVKRKVGRRDDIIVCRSETSRRASMRGESDGRIDSNWSLVPRIVPIMPEREATMHIGSEVSSRWAALPFDCNGTVASGGAMNTMWSRRI
jgi:hypothetical protein